MLVEVSGSEGAGEGGDARQDSTGGVGVRAPVRMSLRARDRRGAWVVSGRRCEGVGSTGMSRAASCGLASGARMRGRLGERAESGARTICSVRPCNSAVEVLIVVDGFLACGD